MSCVCGAAVAQPGEKGKRGPKIHLLIELPSVEPGGQRGQRGVVSCTLTDLGYKAALPQMLRH